MTVIHLDEINAFFKNPKETPMPRLMLMLMSNNNRFIYGKFETTIIKFGDLKDNSPPEMIQKLKPFESRQSMPVLLNRETLEYSVYASGTGGYVGEFKSNHALLSKYF